MTKSELFLNEEVNTFTLIARCPSTGSLGITVATHSLAVGAACPTVQSGVGALASQAFGDPRLRTIGMDSLINGLSALDSLKHIQEVDPFIDYRQIGIIDGIGSVAVHTGSESRAWAGHKMGRQFVVMGNALVGANVVESMANRFQASKTQRLEDRLMGALEAGRDAGGQPQGQRSAALIVFREENYPWVDLRVDAHHEPVRELRRVFELYKPMIPYYYYMRPMDPANLPSQQEWMDQYKRGSTKPIEN